MARGKEGAGYRRAQCRGVGNGDICHSVNNKNKEKKIKLLKKYLTLENVQIVAPNEKKQSKSLRQFHFIKNYIPICIEKI